MDNLLSKKFIKEIKASRLCGNSAEMMCTRQDNDTYKVTFTYDLPEDCVCEDCQVCISAPDNPDFAWSPHLTPEDGYIIQQHVFRTPAMIFGYTDKTLIFFPDIDAMKEYDGFWYMDMDASKGKMYFGISDSRIKEHVLYKKTGKVLYKKGKVKISFYIFLADEKMSNPFRPVLCFYWNNYGKQHAMNADIAKKDINKYIMHTYDWAFKNWKSTVWQEFEENGVCVGAPVFIVNTTQSPNYREKKRERETRSIWNQAWFCSLRSASGLFRYAKRTNSSELMEYANKTKELALSFPQVDGLFDSVIATEMRDEWIDGVNFMASLGWETRYFGNSNRNPFTQDIKKSPKHILDMSFTAEYMLIWYEELERDERLLEYAKKYADRLIEMQSQNGFFPGWVDESGKPMRTLDNSPESAMSAVFLLHMGRITGNEKFIITALKTVEALEREIIPFGRWEDFETYWSCSTFWNNNVGEKIPRNNMYKQNTLSIFYTAWAFLDAYEHTKKEVYLDTGRRVLDEMLMFQSSYQPSGISVPVVGGFGVMNADAELNDARQSLFAEIIIRYGKILGENEYIERGIAAMKASFSMMYCDENPETKKQWEKVWKFFNEKDFGFMMENYGHNGKISNDGVGIGEFTIYDWGNGAASEACERIREHFGEEIMKGMM